MRKKGCLYPTLPLWAVNARLLMQDVVSAVYQGDYRIEVTFEDGKKGIVDFTKHLEKGGVFERLKDKAFFFVSR